MCIRDSPTAALYNEYALNCVAAWHDFVTWEEATEVYFDLYANDCLLEAAYWRLDLAVQ